MHRPACPTTDTLNTPIAHPKDDSFSQADRSQEKIKCPGVSTPAPGQEPAAGSTTSFLAERREQTSPMQLPGPDYPDALESVAGEVAMEATRLDATHLSSFVDQSFPAVDGAPPPKLSQPAAERPNVIIAEALSANHESSSGDDFRFPLLKVGPPGLVAASNGPSNLAASLDNVCGAVSPAAPSPSNVATLPLLQLSVTSDVGFPAPLPSLLPLDKSNRASLTSSRGRKIPSCARGEWRASRIANAGATTNANANANGSGNGCEPPILSNIPSTPLTALPEKDPLTMRARRASLPPAFRGLRGKDNSDVAAAGSPPGEWLVPRAARDLPHEKDPGRHRRQRGCYHKTALQSAKEALHPGMRTGPTAFLPTTRSQGIQTTPLVEAQLRGRLDVISQGTRTEVGLKASRGVQTVPHGSGVQFGTQTLAPAVMATSTSTEKAPSPDEVALPVAKPIRTEVRSELSRNQSMQRVQHDHLACPAFAASGPTSESKDSIFAANFPAPAFSANTVTPWPGSAFLSVADFVVSENLIVSPAVAGEQSAREPGLWLQHPRDRGDIPPGELAVTMYGRLDHEELEFPRAVQENEPQDAPMHR